MQVFNCVKRSAEGGESLFVDGLKVREEMRTRVDQDTFQLLSSIPVVYHVIESPLCLVIYLVDWIVCGQGIQDEVRDALLINRLVFLNIYRASSPIFPHSTTSSPFLPIVFEIIWYLAEFILVFDG